MRLFTLLFLLITSSSLLAQSTLVRGPYLNILTHEGVVVRWKTTNSETGMIRQAVKKVI